MLNGKKPSLLLVRRILMEQTDENHILSTNAILRELKNEYGLDLERRALYSNVDLLVECGDDISRYSENHRGYYVRSRKFSEGEVLLLANAIHANHFIPENESTILIQKLLETQSLMVQEKFYDHVFDKNKDKTVNQELLDTIVAVSSAIHDEKIITFFYSHYEEDMQLHPRMDDNGKPHKYTMEPRFVMYENGRPYLVATSKDHDGQYIPYRLDKMSNVKVSRKRVRRIPDMQDAYEHAMCQLYMYVQDPMECEFLLKKDKINNFVDLFGSRLEVLSSEDAFLKCKVKASRQGLVMLAKQYAGSMIILNEDLREEVKTALKEALEMYQ